MSQQFNVMVPINWTGGTTNRFRVPVEYNGELTKEAVAEIKKVAVDYVLSRGQTLAAYGKVEVYRKTMQH